MFISVIESKSSLNSIFEIVVKSFAFTFDSTPPPIKYFIVSSLLIGAIPNVFVFKKIERLYINGVLNSTISRVATPVSNSATVKVGADFNLGTAGSLNYHFTGRIAQVSIYNRVLSTTEIQQNFNTSKTRFGL